MSSNHQDKSNDGTIRILKVAETNSRNVRRRIGRGDPKVASEMSLSTGDAIEISVGKNKKTTVLHWPAYQEDYRKGMISVEGYTRIKKRGITRKRFYFSLK